MRSTKLELALAALAVLPATLLATFTGCSPPPAELNSVERNTMELNSAEFAAVELPAMDKIDPAIAQQLRRWHSALPAASDSAAYDKQAESYGKFGQRLAAYGFLDAASSAFSNATRLDPHNPNWPHYQGIVAFEQGDLEAAAEHFQRSTAGSPNDPWRWLHLGSVWLELGRPQPADRALQRALRLQPSSAAAHERLGRMAASQGDHRKALQQFRRAIELQPEATAVHYTLARALLDDGQPDLAQEHMALRGERQVRWHDPLLEQLGELIHETVFEVIVAQLSRSSSSFDADATLDFALDHLSGVAGASRRMAEWLQHEQDQLDESFRGRFELVLGTLEAAEGNDRVARSHFERAVRLQPELASARLKLARALVRSNRPEDAFEHYTQLLQTSPDHRQARLQRATLWVWAKRYSEALSDLTQADRSHPADAEIIVRLAATRQLAGDREGYERERRRLDELELDAAASAIWYNALASSLEANGWHREATELRGALGVLVNRSN